MEDEVFFDPDLFVNKNYCKRRFEFCDGICQEVDCSVAASTDHDLTGQVVWPVSIFLSWFIASNSDQFQEKTVLEVGAGCGLSGFVASHFCRRVYITDGNDIVLDLLRQTFDQHVPTGRKETIMIEKLVWGDAETVGQLENKAIKDGGFDVVIGADVFCWPNLVAPLVSTVKRSAAADPVFYCGFVCRALSTEKLLLEEARKAGLTVTLIDSTTFLPSPPPSNVESRRELKLLVLRPDSLSPYWKEQVALSQLAEYQASAC